MTDAWGCSWCRALVEGVVCDYCGRGRGDDVARVNGAVVGVK